MHAKNLLGTQRGIGFARTRLAPNLSHLAHLIHLVERRREGILLEVSGNCVCVEISAIPDPDHTQEVRGSSPLAPTIL